MDQTTNPIIDGMFKVGAHFGYSRTRRHPSVKPFIFGDKNNVEIIDLEKTKGQLEAALAFVAELGRLGKTIVFVGNKSEIKDVVKKGAESIGMPYVAERWIGGTLTNATEIKKRVDRLLFLRDAEVKGGLMVYTKKERGVIAKEMSDLSRFFEGIITMRELPKCLFIIDPREEQTAIKEAKQLGIPVVALANSDCNVDEITYPIVGNDGSRSSVEFFVKKIAEAYVTGRENKTETKT